MRWRKVWGRVKGGGRGMVDGWGWVEDEKEEGVGGRGGGEG